MPEQGKPLPSKPEEIKAVHAHPIEKNPVEEGSLVAISHEEYSGDIPHPKLMEAWDRVVPGSAEKIVDRFVAQSEHRIKIEERVVRANNFKQYSGPIFGFIVAMTAICGGLYTALNGHAVLGGTLSFAGLGTLAGAFILNTYWKPPTDKQTQSKFTHNLGRNDKCWCGSGRKYKKCHGT